MAYMEWQDSLATGIPVIDRQHQRIVGYINQLHDLQTRGGSPDLHAVIIALIDYSISHFAFEKSLFQDAGFVDSREHIRIHDDFRNRIYDFKARSEGLEDVSTELLELLQEWLFGHIREEDSRYVEAVNRFLAEQEAASSPPGWLATRLKKFFG